MTQTRQPKGTQIGGQFAPDLNPESTVLLASGEPSSTFYEKAHALYDRGGKALTDRQTPLEQAHIHAQLASDYTKASIDAGGKEAYLGHRHALAAKAHNSASKKWQSLHDRKGDETSAIQASQRAAESGRKASEEASLIDVAPYVEKSGYKAQSARDAQAMGYGDKGYWDYLDASEIEMASKGVEDALTRSLSEALRGNDGI